MTFIIQIMKAIKFLKGEKGWANFLFLCRFIYDYNSLKKPLMFGFDMMMMILWAMKYCTKIQS